MFSCNLRCRLIFLHGCSRTYRVASLRAGPVGRISYNLYRAVATAGATGALHRGPRAPTVFRGPPTDVHLITVAFNTVTLNTVTVDTGHLIPTSLSTATINPDDT